MKLFLISLLLVAASFAQDNTNPYCGPGNTPTAVGMDGPAALPQRCMFTQISSTPSSNPPKYVGPTASLPMVLSSALPGDMIVVDPANVTNVTGKLVLPNGDCTNQKWITIKSASPLLPDEYTGVGPTFASQMPKIVLQASNAIVTAGSCVRLIGIEVTRVVSTAPQYNMISGLGHDVILDRMYIHGTPTTESTRGVNLSNATNVAVINSYISDFHCRVMTGFCGDAQGILGGLSTVADGNFKIVNNYVEASGENILFGGGAALVVTPDITIAFNDLAKPMSWNPKDPTFAPTAGPSGSPQAWIVKNHFELKNAQRVLFEGNLMQNTWGGFTQKGTMILLTPKNQAGGPGVNLCPLCAVTDVTVRYNHGSYAAQSVQFGCGASDNGGQPAACGQDSIHDNVFDHLQYPTCNYCQSFTTQISGGGVVSFGNVWFRNNTLINDTPGVFLSPLTSTGATASNAGLLAFAPPAGLPGMHFDNNVFDAGGDGIASTGGGLTNCFPVGGSTYRDLITKCWPGGSMIGNTINGIANPKRQPWPDGNNVGAAGANQSLIDAAMARRR